MSRLDSFIRRLEAQRAALDMAARLVADVPGVVLELGLGNGRTYDHLRERLPGREIFAFDHAIKSHPACRPDAEHAILGAIEDTLPAAAQRFSGRLALVHSDIGDGTPDYGARMAGVISVALDPALAPGAVVLSDQELSLSRCERLDIGGVADVRRYFAYRRT
jgi:hypothetical protein